MNRDKNHDLCSIVQTLWGVLRQKARNWQPYWILTAILIFYLTAWHSDQNCFLDPYSQIGTENETFAWSWNENIKTHMHGPPTIVSMEYFFLFCLCWARYTCQLESFCKCRIGLFVKRYSSKILSAHYIIPLIINHVEHKTRQLAIGLTATDRHTVNQSIANKTKRRRCAENILAIYR